MRALSILVPILFLLVCCAGPEQQVPPKTASIPGPQRIPDTALASVPPVPQVTLPSGYSLTDTTSWGTIMEDGQRAILRRGAVAIDTVDLTFGVAAVGQDSLVFLPVRTDTVPMTTAATPWYESSPTEHILWTPQSRHELRKLLPFFNSYFSSPTNARDSVIHYWGLAPGNKTNRLYAMRYDFRTAKVDSLSLNREDTFATDYRYHLGLPQVRGDEVSFDGLVLDRTTWRLIRQDPPPN